MTEPGPDCWTVDRVERVRVSHPATGKSAEAATEDEAFGRLARELVRDGDITIGGPRPEPPAAVEVERLPPSAMAQGTEYRLMVAAEWVEILPDLQCRMVRAIWACAPDGKPVGVDLEFRRTPQADANAEAMIAELREP